MHDKSKVKVKIEIYKKKEMLQDTLEEKGALLQILLKFELGTGCIITRLRMKYMQERIGNEAIRSDIKDG